MPPPQAPLPFLLGQPAPTWVRRPKGGHPLRAPFKVPLIIKYGVSFLLSTFLIWDDAEVL
jgi:hypothetical protein